MTRILNYYLLFCALFLSMGCATVDIRPSSLKGLQIHPQQINKGHDLLGEVMKKQGVSEYWGSFKAWRIITEDSWKVFWVRKLTPIPQARQELEFLIHTDTSEAQMKFLKGPKDTQTLNTNQAKNGAVALYLKPVRDYFLWPQTMAFYPSIAYDQEELLEGRVYYKVFVSNGGFEASGQHDQYIVWINAESLQIDYIQFTLRSLLKSYSGVVEYGDYKNIQGIWLPHRIRLKDQVKSKHYSHELTIKETRFYENI